MFSFSNSLLHPSDQVMGVLTTSKPLLATSKQVLVQELRRTWKNEEA